jgi:hypothetical protein
MSEEPELNKHWQKFFSKFAEIDTLDPTEWKEVHVLSYICRRFEQKFGRKFSVTIKGAPGKSPDIYIIKTIYAALNRPNMRLLKDYVDWVFDHKVGKSPFYKIGFFSAAGFANEFLDSRRKIAVSWERSTPVPAVYKTIASELGIVINTYGDLAFIQMSLDRFEDKTSPNYILMGNLDVMGLDINRLRKLK